MTARSTTKVAVVVLLLAACGDRGQPSDQITLDNALEDRPAFIDLDPDPRIVEVHIVAGMSSMEYLSGKLAEVWAYRDGSAPDARATVPGPTLRAKVGDQIVAHVTNMLSAPTTVHWHGLRLPANADGSTSTQN